MRQGSVRQLRTGAIARSTGHIAICMCFHPRNLAARFRDEYLSSLAPDQELFRDWQEKRDEVGHDRAFAEARYQERFHLGAKAFRDLERLTELSREKHVYIVCQCETGFRCHREMLLLTARQEFGAETGLVYHQYPTYLARVSALRRVAEAEAETEAETEAPAVRKVRGRRK